MVFANFRKDLNGRKVDLDLIKAKSEDRNSVNPDSP
jgi:hypothetical protein